MTLEEVCLEYDRLARLRDSLKAAVTDYQPPPHFTQQEADCDKENQRRAMKGDLSEAFDRLDACGADPELIALARDCLAAEPEGRPRDAGAVAGRVGAYLSGVQEVADEAKRSARA